MKQRGCFFDLRVKPCSAQRTIFDHVCDGLAYQHCVMHRAEAVGECVQVRLGIIHHHFHLRDNLAPSFVCLLNCIPAKITARGRIIDLMLVRGQTRQS